MSQTPDLQGLSQNEVIQRRAAGLGNDVKFQSSRSYRQILRENVFTFINAVFFGISLVFILLGRFGDAILVVVVVFGAMLVSVYQEIWAKQKLDRIALLNRPKAVVIRSGREAEIDPNEIVVGDIIPVHAGDQILVDGVVIGLGRIEVDESLLTGESDLIPKVAGDQIFSGSICVSGSVYSQTEKVGNQTTAHNLVTGARAYRQALTPLQREINQVIRVFLLTACFLWILTIIGFISNEHSLKDLVQRIAVIAGLVPAGLLIAITLAYGLGAVRMLGQNVLIQQANAVESLSNVDVLCLDKTGTLTTNQISLQTLVPIGVSQEELIALLANYAANTSSPNKTTEAIAAAYPGKTLPVVAEVPFSSVRKWSALAFKSGVYFLGAPEAFSAVVSLTPEIQEFIQTGVEQGLRVLLFASSPDVEALIAEEMPHLPLNLIPLGVINFSDVLRPEARETLMGFASAGVELKVISGDNPQTVAALAKQVGFHPDAKLVSGQQLAQMDQVQFTQAALTNTIFGRITPEQKARLVEALRNSGRYVAMTGDGVNDVLSLKQANLAIAMESGSKATRAVADIVLLKDSFSALPQALIEGQRIRNGAIDAMKLFLVRGICITLLIFSASVVTNSFPLDNKQSALIALVGVGFPTTVIPIWAKPGAIPRRGVVRSMLHFVIPASLTLTLVALLVYLLFLIYAVLDLPPGANLSQLNRAIPRTALTTILVMGQLLLIPFLKPPTRAWVAGEPLSRDWRYTITAFVLIVVYFIIVSIPANQRFFELASLSPASYLFIAFVALDWCLIVRLLWRTRFFDNFLGIDLT
ncbi:HAD-IC family P-type ATPase [Iningainema sp. BLCCT55]|uniref:HAD-IC family P-type ATPase n=2 Tax=Iningainema TaxID=1932705 RepID=A0A8J6XNX8_9CYAN|nr:HAD-IC family P-type ATPase [Iningainema tapete BLCC-T55]